VSLSLSRSQLIHLYPCGTTLSQAEMPARVQVSRAVNLATGEEVALKRVFPQRTQRGAAPPACNLTRELAALRALRHPNVLALRDVLQQARAPVNAVCMQV